ncbi:MAG: hypothetical protein K940chlam3_00994 [Chlamydiae bacterium]|nr:hypothetical protein [Chlamydiota bacterium]
MMITRPTGNEAKTVTKNWEIEKTKKEKEICDKIFKQFKEAIDGDILTDKVTADGVPGANKWEVNITDPHCGQLSVRIMEPLIWLGLTILPKESFWMTSEDEKTTFYQYDFTIVIDPSSESDPSKKAALKRKGWDWNKYEKTKLIDRISKQAHTEYRDLLKVIERTLKKHPLYKTWQVTGDNVSRRVLDWVKEDFSKMGFTMTEKIGKEIGEDVTDNVVQLELKKDPEPKPDLSLE